MKDYKIILASQSPRRKELLSQLHIPFDILIKEEVDEVYPQEMPHSEVPVFLAQQKAQPYINDIEKDNLLVITADTIVCCNNLVLGKPKDKDDAFNMLRQLSGQAHEVITGVALTAKGKQRAFTVCTKVFFKTLSDDEINFYIDRFKPFDKAGAYGIQEWIGMIGIERIEGSYFNVVGLPVQKLYEELQQF